MTENNDKLRKKLLIFGLDNSGKTSILLSLKRDTNLLSFFSLRPTKGVNIEELSDEGIEISVWDFGGQEQYREEYMINFNKYSEKAEKIIFVIDVQDFKKYEPALEYLKKILDILMKNQKFIELSVFLHKYDPNLKEQDGFKDIDDRINTELISEIVKIVPPEIKYKVFKTSIFTVFEKVFMQLA